MMYSTSIPVPFACLSCRIRRRWPIYCSGESGILEKVVGGSGARLFYCIWVNHLRPEQTVLPSNIDPIPNLTSTSQTTLQRPSLAPAEYETA